MAPVLSRALLKEIAAPEFTIGQEEWPSGYLLHARGGMIEDYELNVAETNVRWGKVVLERLKAEVQAFWREYLVLGWMIETSKYDGALKSVPSLDMQLVAPATDDADRSVVDRVTFWLSAL